MKHEVSNTYKQIIRRNGQPILVKVPEFHTKSGLKFHTQNSFTAVVVPLNDSIRNELRDIEAFVKANVKSRCYKPLNLESEDLYINVSKWCKYFQLNFDGSTCSLAENVLLGSGSYTMTLVVSHVYIGPHKDGHTFSLNLFVKDIAYRGDVDLFSLFDDLTSSPPKEKSSTVQETPVKKICNARKRRRKLDEVDM